MSELFSVLLLALLFVGFGFLRLGKDRSVDCGSCSQKDDRSSCATCPLVRDEAESQVHRADYDGSTRTVSRGPLVLVKTHSSTEASDDNDR